MVKDKLAENAAEHFESGETFGALATVRRGTVKQQNIAVIATDRNIYAFRLAWPGQTKIAETLLKIPRDDADVEVTSNRVIVRQRSTSAEHSWKKLRQAVTASTNTRSLSEYLGESPAT